MEKTPTPNPEWEQFPTLFAELDFELNSNHSMGGKSVHVVELTPGTNKILDWECKKCNHKWPSSGSNRIRGNGCPACTNRVIHIDGRNSMALTHPQLANEYLGDPNLVIAGTHQILDWECKKCNHKWPSSSSNRSKLGRGCPACANHVIHIDGRNSMATTHPTLANEYLGDPNTIIAGTNKKLDWECSICQHLWKTSGAKRSMGSGCPVCANRVIHMDGRNSMASTHSQLAIEYLGDPNLVIAGTSNKLNWKCNDCENEWSARGYKRVEGSGCPACANKSIHIDGRNSMASTHPLLAKEYLGDPNLVITMTNKKLDWKCGLCQHIWRARGASRGIGCGCPVCDNKSIHIDGRNSMASTHPQLANEYLGDPNRVIAGTHKKLNWKCIICQHEWKTSGSKRATDKGTGCPSCTKYGFQPHLPGYYYVFEIRNEFGDRLYYKGGITNDLERRFGQISEHLPKQLHLNQVELIKFERGQEARDFETILLRIESIRAPKRDFDGGNELFLDNPLAYARDNGVIPIKS
jgi:Zn finger protein HypA/HybF involved in hydrogenase expression